MIPPLNEARIVIPGQLIGAAEVCEILGISRATMSRHVASGKLKPLAQLDGPKGAFVFDRADIQAVAA